MKTTNCKGCKKPIYWDFKFGKRHPFNVDGTSHFDTCSAADSFRSQGKWKYVMPRTLDPKVREEWIHRNQTQMNTTINWNEAKYHQIPDKHLATLLEELEQRGGPFPYGLCYPDLHFSHCVIKDGKIFAVITSQYVFNKIYEYIHGETPAKEVCIINYKLVTIDIIPADKWEQHIRDEDEQRMKKLKKEHPERWSRIYE